MNDDELRARLRAADPAAGLPPADPARVAELVADVMSTDLTTENRATGTRHRSRLTWVVAAAAVAVIATVGVVGLRALGDDDAEQSPTATEPQTQPPTQPLTVTTLTVPEGGAARCAAPSPELIGSADTAVDGTVTEVVDGWATVKPRHWYAGDPTDAVRVEVPELGQHELLVGVDLEEGGRYLLAATDGQLMICGFSGPYDAARADLYHQAFG